MTRVLHAPDAVRLPTAGTVVERVERRGRAGLAAGGEAAVQTIQGRAPTRTGAAAAAVEARVTRTATGLGLRVAPNQKAHPSSSRRSSRTLPNSVVWQFIEEGVGLLGKNRKLIPRARRGIVPSGGRMVVPSGRGYAGRHVFRSSFPIADRQVDRALDAASDLAIREPIA